MTLFYLHGFTSSARSTKAGYFDTCLSRYGIPLRCPDFNEPDFATLTMTRMLDQLDAEMRDASSATCTLIGSSLGGRLAVLAASRWVDRVDKLVLLAPAIMRDVALLPPDRMAQWKRDGTMAFLHYADNREHQLQYGFYEDLLRYDAFGASFPQSTLVFQGVRDTAVPAREVEAFAASRPNVSLTLLDDEHQLMNSLPRIWNEIETFLELRSA